MESDKAAPEAAADPAPDPAAGPAADPPAKAAGDAAVPPARKEKKKKESWWDTLRFLAIVFLLAIVFRTFVVAPFSIPSGSMLPRLMIGDYLFVSKWPYGYSRYSFPFGIASFDDRVWGGLPERGDVVVFRHPGPNNEDWVKRVIGLPGDVIEVRAGEVILNGRRLQRSRIGDYVMPASPNSPCRRVGRDAREVAGADGPACAYPRYRETLPGGRSYQILDQHEGPGDDTPVLIVPAGHCFMMGDNRDDSADSRFSVGEDGVGMLPAGQLIGRALIVFFSTDGSAEWLKPWTWLSAARWERVGLTY